MGVVARQNKVAAEPVKWDFEGPDYNLTKKDRQALGETRPKSHIFVMLIRALVQAKWPQKQDGTGSMDRTAGKAWAAWQEYVSDLDDREVEDLPTVIEITVGDLKWLFNLAKDDELKVAWNLAQWREALVEYTNSLLASLEPRKEE